jgi:hypothetical protein
MQSRKSSKYRRVSASYHIMIDPAYKVCQRQALGSIIGQKLLDININIDTIQKMVKIEYILIQMKNNSSDVKFSDLSKVCICYFGQARQKGGSHHVYKTPWKGDPRINIQNHKGKAKAYQVKQVLLAIEKLEIENATEK